MGQVSAGDFFLLLLLTAGPHVPTVSDQEPAAQLCCQTSGGTRVCVKRTFLIELADLYSLKVKNT